MRKLLTNNSYEGTYELSLAETVSLRAFLRRRSLPRKDFGMQVNYYLPKQKDESEHAHERRVCVLEPHQSCLSTSRSYAYLCVNNENSPEIGLDRYVKENRTR